MFIMVRTTMQDLSLSCENCGKLYAGENPEFDCQCNTEPFLKFGETTLNDLMNLVARLDTKPKFKVSRQ